MHVRDHFDARDTSVVLMGQGEPFMNYDANDVEDLLDTSADDDTGTLINRATSASTWVSGVATLFSSSPESVTI